MDGQGGAYGHQLQTALGRFARINANLSWEYNTLADVPNWESGTNGGTYSFSVTDRPRHIRVEHDGSSTSNVEGQILGNPLITSQSLGAFRITFHNIQFTDNTDQRFRVGIADASESVDPESGNAIIYGNDVKDRFVVLDSGTSTDITSFTDWSDGRTVSIEYDGVEARAYVDGDNTIEGNTLALPYSVNTDFRPLVHLRDQGSDTVSDVVEVEQVTVEPLPEVLQ